MRESDWRKENAGRWKLEMPASTQKPNALMPTEKTSQQKHKWLAERGRLPKAERQIGPWSVSYSELSESSLFAVNRLESRNAKPVRLRERQFPESKLQGSARALRWLWRVASSMDA